MCLPRMDSPSVFGAILDRDAGAFRLGPEGVQVPAARRYLPGTMVLETSWGTRGGWIIVRDVLLIGPVAPRGRALAHAPPRADRLRRRPRAAAHGPLRQRRGRRSRSAASRCSTTAACAGAGSTPATTTTRSSSGPQGSTSGCAWCRDLNLGIEGPRATARHMMKEGETLFCALAWSEHPAPRTYDDAYERLVWTAHHWQHWLDRGEFPDHPWRSDLQRSALTLKGLTYAPTGAIVAAATTSLPETPGGERNWDYRYTWIRDATFALWGLYTLGFDWEANDFFYFVADVAEAATRTAPDHVRDRRAGGSARGDARPPLRLRERAAGADRQRRPLRRTSTTSGARCSTRSTCTPSRATTCPSASGRSSIDAGRGRDRQLARARPRHLGGPRRAAALHVIEADVLGGARPRRAAGRAARGLGPRDAVAARWPTRSTPTSARNGVDERGVFTQHYDTDALDASVLLMPLVRFLPADDPRIRATVLAIADELTEDGLVLRYRVEETDDGLSGEEGTFTICSFWLVSALSEIGELDRARGLCERLLSHASPLGLYAEEIDPRTGRHLGNFPQAFTHLALINAVMHVIRAEQHDSRVVSPPQPLPPAPVANPPATEDSAR